jgi:ABC-2 type transport system permease protein
VLCRGFSKYWAVFRVAVRNQLAYISEACIRSMFIVIIMYVFANLWATTYQASHQTSFSGYTAKAVVWYLVVTEAIVVGTPRIVNTLSEEIKQGDIAYRLTKPIHYVLYNYAQFLGEAVVRMVVNLVLGGVVALAFYGRPPVTILSSAAFLVSVFVGITAQFTMTMVICLLLFWIEDGRGLDLILSRLVMILGGMMIPLPLFPAWLGNICEWLPFQAVAYLPAHTLVEWNAASVLRGLGISVMWVTLFAGLCSWLYRKGVRQLHVQGG